MGERRGGLWKTEGMKAHRVRYTPEAAALIRRLHPEVKRIVRDGIRALLKKPLLGHELHLELSGFRSHRVKTYRILYQINNPEGSLDVLFVGHRRDIYESFRSLLIEQASK